MKGSAFEGIAIIGMSCRYPGAGNLEQFWRNLVAGVESISTFSDEELAASGLDVPALRKDSSYIAARGIIENAEWFDAAFFGMNAKEAELTDPQQRLFLEAAWEALENAGYDPERVHGPIGVYAGMGRNTYYLHNLLSRGDLADLMDNVIKLGNEKDFLATRIAYKLNLKGPAVNVNNACSTSLVAVCQACQSLLTCQCDMALAGGVTITIPQRKGNYYQEGGAISPDGHCRPFDAQAQGTVFSDGLGIVVLKRLADAVKDGDQVYAVIKGFALNNDGSAKVGFTAPSVDGQAEVIGLALADAGFDPATISYVEAHGTATPLGDPIEIAALTQAFRLGTAARNFCAIGSVKGNIGHVDTAAGVTGLIKAALALKSKLLPPSLHFTKPNPRIDFADSPFFVNTRLAEWEAGPTPRRAGVSSFGFGGTNAHVVLEEGPEDEEMMDEGGRMNHDSSFRLQPSAFPAWQLILLSARTPTALDAASKNLAEHLKQHPELNLADVAYTLQAGRRHFDHRRMLLCRDREDLLTSLESSQTQPANSAVVQQRAPCPHGRRSVVFMFSGQGAQYVNMGGELYESESTFRDVVDRCCELLMPRLGFDLRTTLYPQNGCEAEASRRLQQTAVTQPALFVIELALTRLWMSWGIKPDALIGHSIGEYVAACVAGVFSVDDALALVAERGRLMQSMPSGTMFAVTAPEEDIERRLPPELSLAAVNGPSSCVVSGSTPAIEAFQARLAKDGIAGTMLHTSHAFHSAMMDPMVRPFTERVDQVKRHPPGIPFISNATGGWISAADAASPEYWAKHLRGTVRFADGIKELLNNPDHVLLEVGPGTTLCSLARQHLRPVLDVGRPDRTILPSLRHPQERQSDVAYLLGTLGRLWLSGVNVDWSGFHAGRASGADRLPGAACSSSAAGRRRVSLPTYPFERQRYWAEIGCPSPATALRLTQDKKPDLADCFYIPSWKRSELPRNFRKKSGGRAENAGGSLISCDRTRAVGTLDRPEETPGTQDSGCWLVFLPESGFAATLTDELESWRPGAMHPPLGGQNVPMIGGWSVTRVIAGESYRKIDEGTYAINPQRREDYDALIGALCAAGKCPQKVLHAWHISAHQDVPEERPSLETSQILGLHSLLFLTQALAARDITAPLEIDVISSGVHLVTGGEVISPEKATILGACKVIPLEHLNFQCRAIDVIVPQSGSQAERTLIEQLRRELATGPSDPIVAYRGAYRWIETFEPVHLEPASIEDGAGVAPRLKPEGVYLITGGLGGIGLVFAEFLARNVRAKLVLIGRTPFPPQAQWEHWLDAHDETDETSVRIRKLQGMEAAGAEVLIAAADVSDREQMRAAIAQAGNRFGRINGVIHAAGLADYKGVIQRRSKQDTDEILASKVKGALVLDELLAERGTQELGRLDFLVLCSSINTVHYRPMLGQVAYVAANDFLDAFARRQSARDGVYTVAINFPPWEEVGMAAEVLKRRAKSGKTARAVSTAGNWISPSEGAETLNRILGYDFARVVISIKELNALARGEDHGQAAGAGADRDQASAGAMSGTMSGTMYPWSWSAVAKHPRPEMKNAALAPRNETEALLAGIWRELLGIEEVGVHDNFFELGGESLLGTQVISRVRKVFNVDLSLHTLYEASTVAAMAEAISQRQRDHERLEQTTVMSEIDALSEEELEAELSRRQGSQVLGRAGLGADLR